jgi:pyrroline-5-carboxylate reductase
LDVVLAVFRTCSKVVIPLRNEDQINAVTAVSGSGPAYVFHLIEGMVEGGIKEGLTREESTALAIQTVIGAGMLHSSFI